MFRRSDVAGVLPTPDETDRLAGLFRLMGDPTRTRLLYALVANEECNVGELAELVGASESTVSHALRWLRAHHVVRSRRAGRMVFYRLDDDHVRELLELGLTHVRHPAGLPERRAEPPAAS